MKFTFETEYNQKALCVMAKCIRKTARAKHSKRGHIFGWIVIALALLLSFSSGDEGFVITFKTVITWVAAAVMLIVLLFEDKINGCFAGKRMLKAPKNRLLPSTPKTQICLFPKLKLESPSSTIIRSL